MVRCVKVALRHSLGNIHLNYQDITTLIYKIKYIINSRPITFSNGNDEDNIPISPNDFLIPCANLNSKDNIPFNQSIYSAACKENRKFLGKIWARWKNEYVFYLNRNNPPTANTIKLGSIKLLDESTKRQYWPIVKVVELLPGRDRQIRSVKILHKGKILTRPLKLLHPFELPDS